MVDVPTGHLYLGSNADDERLMYEASNFTTHGVIVGMTGSGKTGLGMIVLEEALMQNVPTLIIDPKGDMGNLLLTFPDLSSAEFRPWINPADADREGKTVDQIAADTSALWTKGLERSGIDKSRIGELRSKVDMTIYTPGSSVGVPLNIIGSMQAPGGDVPDETVLDEIEGLASSLLGLIGVDSDPVSGREHILLANIIHSNWSAGKSLDLGTLIGQIQSPPMRKLGVLDLDTFFPPGDRTKLAMQLNGLAASPAFASWTQGAALDIERMLYGDDGKPQAAVVSIAHLSDEERQFVVTLLLSKLVTWMRSQQGTSDLRALVYMDEVFGFVPPVANPPSKKPILTILKQARAFGVGLVLSTQNPVDIDYKAISNAGTWMIGRLQTERDKARLLEGMTSSGGTVDIKELDATISALDKREFVLHSTRESAPQVFSTRWAMSYLSGPLSREQIGNLMDGVESPTASAPAAAARAEAVAPASAEPELASDEVAAQPPIADGIDVKFVDPAAPWAANFGAEASGRRLIAGLAVRVQMLFDETKADLRHEAEWEAIVWPLDGPVDGDDATPVDYDDRDLRDDPPDQAVYVLPDAKIKNKTYFRDAQTAIKDHLYRKETLSLFQNKELKLYSFVGEGRPEFEARCATKADDEADADVAKLRDTLLTKKDRIMDSVEKAEDKVREIEFEAESRADQKRSDQILDVAGAVLGGLFGGRRSTRSVLSGVRRSRSTERMQQKAEERLRTAQNRYTDLVEDLQELEDEVADDMAQIQQEWDDKAAAITEIEVGLEKADISIDDVALIWIPVD